MMCRYLTVKRIIIYTLFKQSEEPTDFMWSCFKGIKCELQENSESKGRTIDRHVICKSLYKDVHKFFQLFGSRSGTVPFKCCQITRMNMSNIKVHTLCLGFPNAHHDGRRRTITLSDLIHNYSSKEVISCKWAECSIKDEGKFTQIQLPTQKYYQ